MAGKESSVNASVLRQAMRQWATGITVVTASLDGTRHGMTVSSFISVSLSPPLVMVSLAHSARTRKMVAESKVFGITILSDVQQTISDRFAGRETEFEDRFQGLETFSFITSVPLLAGGLASFDCRVVALHEVGDHSLFIGQVLAAQVTQDTRPLIYYDRAYRNLE